MLKDSLKIAQIVRSAQHGGVETHVLDLLRHGKEAGHDMQLVSLADVLASDQFLQMDVPIIKTDDTQWMSRRSLTNILPLVRILREMKPDVVHVHGTRPILVGSIAARLARIKRVVATIHNSYSLMGFKNDGTIDKRLLLFGKLIYLTGFRLCNTIITDADWLASEARGIVQGLPLYSEAKLNTKMTTIHIGIDAHLYRKDGDTSEIRKHFGIGPETTIIGTVSRLDEPKKGIGVLLRAVALLKGRHDFHLLIVGGGDAKQQLIHLAAELGVMDLVTFVGFWEELPDIMAKFDIFVLPSLSEGFPIVNLEAMASALPVVSTNVGGVAEAVREGTNGLLVPPGDAHALADALQKILADPAAAKEMGRCGRSIVESEFTKSVALENIFSLYES